MSKQKHHPIILYIICCFPTLEEHPVVPKISPAAVLSSDVEIRRQRHIQEGKPRKIAERQAINETRRHLFELCLMEQETEMGHVEDLIKDVIARTGEFIRVGEFHRT